MDVRRTLRIVVGFLFRVLTRMEVTGKDNIPGDGSAILAVNHLGRLDPPLVFILLERDDVTALVAKKYYGNPFFRWLINAVSGIWLDRENPDARAIREAVQFLRSGGLLGVAPEGTRSTTQALQRGKPGVAYLALAASAPIIPTAITGTERVFPELIRLRRPRIHIEFGEPFYLEPVERKNRDEALQARIDEVMCRIAALLPPEYRGVYAGHPYLEKLGG